MQGKCVVCSKPARTFKNGTASDYCGDECRIRFKGWKDASRKSGQSIDHYRQKDIFLANWVKAMTRDDR